MTPAARLSAAMVVLEQILAGRPAEAALTGWARASRFAGSGDRAAVRDLVFDALRCRRSFAALGGAETGRGLILGGQRAAGADVAALFTGEGHAPAPVTAGEAGQVPGGMAALDLPDWLEAPLRAALGADFTPVVQALRLRAPVFLRVNAARLTRDEAVRRLAGEGIGTCAVDGLNFGLQVTDGARKIQSSDCYSDGLVELQDAASQAVVEALPLRDGMRVLDHCAGGGGKTLAMAARARLQLCAHDASPARMTDLAARATRAGAVVARTDRPEAQAPYDLVLVDAPCSGSGSWRRDPAGKWALTPARLDGLMALQAAILDRAAAMVAGGGTLAYATCSLLEDENGAQVAAFLQREAGARRHWTPGLTRRFTPLTGGDGFFLATLTRI